MMLVAVLSVFISASLFVGFATVLWETYKTLTSWEP